MGIENKICADKIATAIREYRKIVVPANKHIYDIEIEIHRLKEKQTKLKLEAVRKARKELEAFCKTNNLNLDHIYKIIRG